MSRDINHEDFIWNEYKRAVESGCFSGSFESFKEWRIKYCWGLNGHPDPPGELGVSGPTGQS